MSRKTCAALDRHKAIMQANERQMKTFKDLSKVNIYDKKYGKLEYKKDTNVEDIALIVATIMGGE